MERSSVYWDETIAPSLRGGKTVLIVGHENNLRSLIMRLEDIPEDDIINLSLPRAVPLAYRLDENLKPLPRPDGKLDEATGFLRGEWLGGDKAVAQILERDRKQVYDTSIEKNLELCEDKEKWRDWMEFAMGKPTPEQRAAACTLQGEQHHESVSRAAWDHLFDIFRHTSRWHRVFQYSVDPFTYVLHVQVAKFILYFIAFRFISYIEVD